MTNQTDTQRLWPFAIVDLSKRDETPQAPKLVTASSEEALQRARMLNATADRIDRYGVVRWDRKKSDRAACASLKPIARRRAKRSSCERCTMWPCRCELIDGIARAAAQAGFERGQQLTASEPPDVTEIVDEILRRAVAPG